MHSLMRKLGFGLVMLVAVVVPVLVLTRAPWWVVLAILVLLALWMALTRI